MLEDFDHAVPFEVTNRGAGANAVWGIRHLVVGAVVVLVLFFIFATAIVYPVVEATHEDSPEALAAQAIAVLVWDVSMVLVVYFLIRRKGARWTNLGLKQPLPRLDGTERTAAGLFAFVLLLYAAAICSVQAYSFAIDLLGLEDLVPGQQLPDTFFDNDWLVAMIGVSIVIGAPIAEEVFFRGFLFGGLRRRLPFVAAGLISGFVFSLAHADLGLILPFTIVGFILAFAYERTGSLYASMGVHFMFNAVSFLILVFVPEARNT